jgi:TetR/AcrR family transcriptional regulator, repressor of fatR-cypB operon
MTTKEKILASARKLFIQKGIDKTSTNLIAQEVGIAAGTIFVHFKTKQEIVDTLYLDSKQNLFEGVKGSFEIGASIKSNYYTLSRAFIDYFLQNPEEYLFQKLIKKGIDVSSHVMKKGDEPFGYIYQSIHEAIQQGQLKQVNPTLLFRLTWNNLLTIVEYCRDTDQQKVPQEYLDLIWEQVSS